MYPEAVQWTFITSYIAQVAEEVIGCWKSQDLPTQIIQTVVNKLKLFYKRRKGIYLSANV